MMNVAHMATLLAEAVRQLGGTLRVSDVVLAAGRTPVFSQRRDDDRQELILQVDEGSDE